MEEPQKMAVSCFRVSDTLDYCDLSKVSKQDLRKKDVA